MQYLLPQHTLSRLAGWLAECRQISFKNALIQFFIKAYHVDMREAVIEDPQAYPSFNAFFTRLLKSELRPITAAAIACPADGTLAQFGSIKKDQLIQAKNFYFDLDSLLGQQNECVPPFIDGSFATIYLAPHNYHRVHMPLRGQLIQTIYLPGNLFSVNRMTSEFIPQLYSRNERLVCLFQTEIGKIAVILVGAMIVGSIQTVWMDKPLRAKQMQIQTHTDGITLNKGDELGLFKMGSTVILLFPKDTICWSSLLQTSQLVQMGEELASLC